MNLEEVLGKIEELKKDYTEEFSLNQLERWEKDIKEAGSHISALQLEVVKKGLLQWSDKLRQNKIALSQNQELSAEERQQMFAENKVYKEVIDYFTNPAEYIKYIKNEIEKL